MRDCISLLDAHMRLGQLPRKLRENFYTTLRLNKRRLTSRWECFLTHSIPWLRLSSMLCSILFIFGHLFTPQVARVRLFASIYSWQQCAHKVKWHSRWLAVELLQLCPLEAARLTPTSRHHSNLTPYSHTSWNVDQNSIIL